MITRLLYCLLICAFISCESISQIVSPDLDTYKVTTAKKIDSDWYQKDIIQDSVPGTSLYRVYNTLLKNKRGKEVIVAVLDMSVDIEHTYLKENIWTNTKEIEGNHIDDDHNGYIDDVHGWNFLGNQNNENLRYEQFECVRIIKKLINNKTLTLVDSLLFIRVKAAYDSHLKDVNAELENANMVIKARADSDAYLKNIFNNKAYTVSDLDSLKQVFPKDTLLQTEVLRMSNFIKYGYTPEYNTSRKESLLNSKKYILNQEYPERAIIGDSVKGKLYSIYGNNQVDAHATFLSHGTFTSGFLTTKYLRKDSINIFENIKIMPLRVSAYGSEYDKDIALAIRYAVDQGAKVINMSFGKRFSLDKHWVDEAIMYAERKGVLIVKSAGNERFNTDFFENTKYPNDYNDEAEFSNNFITVGGTSHSLDDKFLYRATNYGKKTVDVFAPGSRLTTLSPDNEIRTNMNGTSFSTAIVSGIAALIRSYYPSLTASEVKQILMDSSVKYDILVDVPTKENPEQQLPFNQLSKSGGIVNAYNAMLMAEEFVKTKSRK